MTPNLCPHAVFRNKTTGKTDIVQTERKLGKTFSSHKKLMEVIFSNDVKKKLTAVSPYNYLSSFRQIFTIVLGSI